MQLIKMLKTIPGSPDGKSVCSYQEGREYELPNDLAKAFLGMEAATIVRARSAEPPVQKIPEASEEDDFKEAPKNKDQEEEKEESIRVYELAEELGVSAKKIIKIAQELRPGDLKPASYIPSDMVEYIRRVTKKE